METKLYQQGDRLVESEYGKDGFELLKQLNLLAVKKDLKVYEFFKKNAMNTSHYMEFRKARITSDDADTIRTKSYVVVSTLNNNNSLPFSYFIIGIDDTTSKLFCHRLPSGDQQWINTDKKVQKAMGFDTEFLEICRSIRIQGDLTMRIAEQADTPEKIFGDLVYTHLKFEIGSYMENLDLDDEYTRLSDITWEDSNCTDYQFLKGALDRHGMIAEKEELERLYGPGHEIHDSLEKLCNNEGYGAYLHKVAKELQASIVYQKELDFMRKNRQRITQKLYDNMTRREARYTVMQGDHKITLTASIDVSGRQLHEIMTIRRHRGRLERSFRTLNPSVASTNFYILRPSTITIEHKEHGKREIMIMKPSRVSFGILNRYQGDGNGHRTTMEIIQNVQDIDGRASIVRVLEEAEREGIDRASATRRINDLERMGEVFSPMPGFIRTVRAFPEVEELH